MKIEKVVFKQKMKIGRTDKVLLDIRSKTVPALDIDLDLKTRIITASGFNPGLKKAGLDDVIFIPLESVAYFTRTKQSMLADAARAAKK